MSGTLLTALRVGCQAIDLLSASGSLFNIIATIGFKIHKSDAGKMVIGISLMDIISSIADCLGYFTGSTTTAAFWSQYFTEVGRLGSIFWCCCFAHSLYSTVRAGELEVVRKYMKTYLLISMFVPFLFGIAFYLLRLGSEDNAFTSLGMMDLYLTTLPIMLAIVYCLGCYIGVVRNLRRFEGDMYAELLLFPIILIICNCPLSIFEIYMICTGNLNVEPVWLVVTTIMLSNAQGLINSIAYGSQAKIKNELSARCCKKRNGRNVASFHQDDRVYTIVSDSSDCEISSEVVNSRYKAMSWTNRTITAVPNSL